MKKMKKFFALLIAMVMVLGMSTSVFAANHNVSTDSDTHTYQIYQIFTGDYDTASQQLQNLKYGQNAKTGTAGESVSATDMAALDAIAKAIYSNDQEKITALTPYVDLASTPIAEIGKGKETSASLAEGYYIIKDTDNSLEDPEGYTLYLFQVLNDDLEIEPKSGTTIVDKEVAETNDTTGQTTTAQNGADYDEGDSIPYTLNITLAENVTAYKKYEVTLTDTLSEGLTAPAAGAITVSLVDANDAAIDGSAIAGFTAPAASVDGQKITVTFSAGNGTDAIGNAGNALNNAKIVVTYSAVLNEKAKSGVEGNPNTYTITYSNNPNGSDTGTTPDKEVKVYSYDLNIAKVDGNNEPLEGAGFTLYKKVTASYEGAQTGAAIKAALAQGVNGTKLVDTDYYVPVTMTETVTKDGDTVTKVTHSTDKSIDAGTYVLVETTVPSGYNAYEGMDITITSTIDDEGNLTGLTATPAELTIASDMVSVDGNVENKSGSILPSTGGIGTTIFYVVGAILVIGAGVVLVTRRRMDAQ